jgi:hypothetical protein
MNIRFRVHAHHSTIYLVDLPPYLPDLVQDKLISVFKKKLQRELSQAIKMVDTGAPGRNDRPTHKSKQENRSLESIGSAISVSTGGVSAGCTTIVKEQGRYKEFQVPS